MTTPARETTTQLSCPVCGSLSVLVPVYADILTRSIDYKTAPPQAPKICTVCDTAFTDLHARRFIELREGETAQAAQQALNQLQEELAP